LIQNLALRRARIKATTRAQTLIRQLADRVILIYKKAADPKGQQLNKHPEN